MVGHGCGGYRTVYGNTTDFYGSMLSKPLDELPEGPRSIPALTLPDNFVRVTRSLSASVSLPIKGMGRLADLFRVLNGSWAPHQEVTIVYHNCLHGSSPSRIKAFWAGTWGSRSSVQSLSMPLNFLMK